MSDSQSLWDVLGPPFEQLTEAVSQANFALLIRNPYFIGLSVVFLVICVMKKWRIPLVGYFGTLFIWGIVYYTVLAQTLPGSTAFVVMAVFAVAVVLIYFLLIKD